MKAITLRQFLATYFFRVALPNEVEDTQIVRIYPPEGEGGWFERKNSWIEFGINDFGETYQKMNIAEKFLNKMILDCNVDSFSVDPDTSTLHVWLTQEEEIDFY